MGIRSWWLGNRERAASQSQVLSINSDQELIAQQVPELIAEQPSRMMAKVDKMQSQTR